MIVEMAKYSGNTTIHYFTCSDCKNQIPLPRKKSKLREKNHIKDIYCPFCGEIKKFVESNY